MATRTYGQLSEFHPESESITSYVERAGLFFRANDIVGEKQSTVFLSVIGRKTYALLRNLVAPDLPQDKTLPDIIAALQNHFEPKPLVIAQHFHFHRRNQLPNESVAEYVAELRRLSTHCDFGKYLNDALRDRLICGLRNESIQKSLLAIKDLTFKTRLSEWKPQTETLKRCMPGQILQQCISYRSNAHRTLPPFRSRVHASHVIDAEGQIMTRQAAASLTLLAGTVEKGPH